MSSNGRNRTPSQEAAAVCEFGDSRPTCVLRDVLDACQDLETGHRTLARLVKTAVIEAKAARANAKAAQDEARLTSRKLDKILRHLGIAAPFILLLVMTGCKTTAVQGLCSVRGQEKHTLGTKQPCIRSSEAIRAADLAALLTLEAFVRHGVVKDRERAVLELQREGNLVCLVLEPEPCCVNSACVGPYKEIGDTVVGARKAGCASMYHAWASVRWPFVCGDTWPDEPHCTQDPSAIDMQGWPERLRHEVFNMLTQRWAGLVAKARENQYETQEIYKLEPEVSSSFGNVWRPQ